MQRDYHAGPPHTERLGQHLMSDHYPVRSGIVPAISIKLEAVDKLSQAAAARPAEGKRGANSRRLRSWPLRRTELGTLGLDSHTSRPELRCYHPHPTPLSLSLPAVRDSPVGLPGRGWSRRWRPFEVALLVLVGPLNARRDIVVGSPMKARASRIAIEASSVLVSKKRQRGCG